MLARLFAKRTVASDSADIGGDGAGSASLEGYEYQVDVSIWLALDLILALRAATHLQLEPSSQEDVEADMSVASTLVIETYRLVVQAKLRSGDAWTIKSIESLLQHGTARKPVKERLKDPKVRYLLVTSAGLNGVTRDLLVRRPGNWPSSEVMPRTLVKLLGESASGRLAIIGTLDPERLQSYIKDLLIDTFRVPAARWKVCLKALREATRTRIRGGDAGRWRAEDLEAVIREHDGYIAVSRDLENYVHPTNWDELKRLLAKRHAAIIIGQSGTGKTMATKQLYAELRKAIPGLSRVVVTRGPQQINEDQTSPPVLYDIEDPWGRFDFETVNRPWNDQLANHFSKASPSRLFVATSRLDVAQSSGALNTVEPWMFTLEAEHYGKAQRTKLYRTRIASLPRLLQALAHTGEREVLERLTTPLEIQKFFDALATVDQAAVLKNAIQCRNEAVARAHQDSIERTVIEQIGQRNDVRAATVIWALLRANDRLSLTTLRRLESALADLDPAFDSGVQPLVGFFIAARNLRQSDDFVSYYHPRVEAGVESVMRSNGLVVRRAMRTLIEALATFDTSDETWGASIAGKVISASRARFPSLSLTVGAAAQHAIDQWISSSLPTANRDFDELLRIAAAAGSADCNAAEIARFLTAREDRKIGFGMTQWISTPHNDEWYARMAADPVVANVLTKFLLTSLPKERDEFENVFVHDVLRLFPSASIVFVNTALKIVRYGMVHTVDVIAYGALQEIQSFEPVIDEAVKELTPTEERQKDSRELRLDVVNEVFSDDYADHITESDDGYTAHEFVKAYVSRARALNDWRRIANHRHLSFLLDVWLRALHREPKPSSEELSEAYSRSHGGASEASFWSVLLRAWDGRYIASAIDRVVAGGMDHRTEMAAMLCVVRHEPRRIAEIVNRLIDLGYVHRLAEIGMALGEDRGDWYYGDLGLTADVVDHAIALFPPTIQEIAIAAFSLSKRVEVALSPEARSLLPQLEGRGLELSEFRLKLDAQFNVATEDDVRRVLNESTESDVAVLAIRAAIRRGMRAHVEEGIQHKFAHVVALALGEIAGPLPAPLPDRLLELRNARGSPIRAALVAQLEAKPHPDHVPILLELVSDHWTKHEYPGGDPDFPIATAAFEALTKCGALDTDAQDYLFEVAQGSRDSTLRQRIFSHLAKAYGFRFQERLFVDAIDGGAGVHRKAAAQALLSCGDYADSRIVSGITDEMLRTTFAPVAVKLCLLLAWQADVERIVSAAASLATHRNRRVFLVLMIWLLSGRDEVAARSIAAFLPDGHLAIRWAFGERLVDCPDSLLDDLGDVRSVSEVMSYVRSRDKDERT